MRIILLIAIISRVNVSTAVIVTDLCVFRWSGMYHRVHTGHSYAHFCSQLFLCLCLFMRWLIHYSNDFFLGANVDLFVSYLFRKSIFQTKHFVSHFPELKVTS